MAGNELCELHLKSRLANRKRKKPVPATKPKKKAVQLKQAVKTPAVLARPRKQRKVLRTGKNTIATKAKAKTSFAQQTEAQKVAADIAWEKMKAALKFGPAPRVRRSSLQATKYLSGKVARIVEEEETVKTRGFVDEFLTGGRTVTVFSIHQFARNFMRRISAQQAQQLQLRQQ
jgi:hypothetical protein